MKRLNPFDSQLSAQDRVNQARTRLRTSVLIAAGVCASSLTILLMLQGCKQPEENKPTVPAIDTNTNIMPTFVPEPTNVPPTNFAPTSVTPLQPLVPTNVPQAEIPATGQRVHTVEKNETFSSLAKKYTVSIKAIQDANPGVDSKKLKVGQKLNIPASSSSTAPTTPAVGGMSASTEAGGTVYTVKTGDTLTKIATRHGISVKALKAANNLTTDSIQVGRKLKIPAKSGAAPSTSAAPSGIEPLPLTTTPTNR